MRAESHRRLGKYLAERYMAHIPRSCISAFLFGCIEPDKNPATYIKGSLRHQWLRGHNYRNARRFMHRISRRLERKIHWSLLDYYTLGKLIHYTADAFTQAHNDSFPEELSCHRAYEQRLQNHFLAYLTQDPDIDITAAGSIMEAITAYHAEYEKHAFNVFTDSRFALSACCCILANIFPSPAF